MTFPVSTSKAAKAYLFSVFTSGLVPDPTDASLKLGVYYDEPPDTDTSDLIVVGDVERQVEVSAMVGNEGPFSFQEVYTITVIASVYRGGDSAKAVWERAVDLCEQMITLQRADPTLGGAVILCRPQRVSNPACTWEENHKGRIAEHSVEFYCRGIY